MKKITIILSLAAALTLSGCTSGFDRINHNNNEPAYGQINPMNMLPSLLQSVGDDMLYRTWYLNGELVQYTVSGTSNQSFHRYVIPNTAQASTWNNFCRNAANADEMRRLAIDQENANAEAIALVLRALMLSNVTDCYGDIPFSEAFGLINGSANPKPKFDPQKDVYEALLSDLERANSLWAPAEKIDATKDLLYGGDIAKWQKFGNSLYLRLLMRLSNRDNVMEVGNKIRQIVMNPDRYPVFASNDDNATFYYNDVEPFANYFGPTASSSFTGSRRACATIIDMMQYSGDPRISCYFTQGAERWKGEESGMPVQETELDGIARLNRSNLADYSSPYSIMKYDEVLFICSEAAFRGWLDGGNIAAGNYYKAAIEASVRFWASIDRSGLVVTDHTMNNFMMKVPYDNTLEQILNQKYVALFFVGYEAWHEYRRTGFPKLVIGTATSNDHILPTRFVYPDNTSNVNVDNYRDQVLRLRQVYFGGDDMKTPVWWSLKAVTEGIQ